MSNIPDVQFINALNNLKRLADTVGIEKEIQDDLKKYINMVESGKLDDKTQGFMFDRIMRPMLPLMGKEPYRSISSEVEKLTDSETYKIPVNKKIVENMYAKSIDEIINKIKSEKVSSKSQGLIDSLEQLKTADESPVYDQKGKKIGMVPTPPELKLAYAVKLLEAALEKEKQAFMKSGNSIFSKKKSLDDFRVSVSEGKQPYAKQLANILHEALNINRELSISPIVKKYTQEIADTKLQERQPGVAIKKR